MRAAVTEPSPVRSAYRLFMSRMRPIFTTPSDTLPCEKQGFERSAERQINETASERFMAGPSSRIMLRENHELQQANCHRAVRAFHRSDIRGARVPRHAACSRHVVRPRRGEIGVRARVNIA